LGGQRYDDRSSLKNNIKNIIVEAEFEPAVLYDIFPRLIIRIGPDDFFIFQSVQVFRPGRTEIKIYSEFCAKNKKLAPSEGLFCMDLRPIKTN
jgi:hypothetical protein